jgi:hypothetical protein
VTIIKEIDGEVHIEYKGKDLPFKIFSNQEFSGKTVDSKEIDSFFREKKIRKASYGHPYNKQGRAEAKMKQFLRREIV